MTVRKLKGSAIQTGTITSTQLSGALNSSISAGGGPKISNIIYPGDDTAANTTGGQTVYIVGSGFAANAIVYINGNSAPSVSFISSSNLQITTPALSAASYPVYVINPEDGGTAIKIPGLVISGEPTWSTSATLPEQGTDDAWSISLSATSDSSVTYALADGSSLPSGISLAANGLISGTLSSPPNEDTTYNFTAVATDTENQDASRAFSVTVTTGEGVAFANTVLLLHGDGTNNQNNHTFLDSSNNSLTITRNGNATQGSFSPFSQTGWSGYFDGSGDYLTTTMPALSTGSFTVEFWFHPTNPSLAYLILDKNFRDGNFSLQTDYLYSGVFYLNVGGTSYTISFTPPIVNQWNHIAICRDSSSLRFFLNGVQLGTTQTNSGDVTTGTLYIGGASTTGSGYSTTQGYISNLRIITTALYTSNFTPPTTPLTNIANTSLLTLQSNRFVDNSDNNFTITRNGDTRIVPYSPFAPTSKYTTANVGGSAYFVDGASYLSTPANESFAFGQGDFTIEFYAYKPVQTNAYEVVFATGSDGNGANGLNFELSDTRGVVIFTDNSIILQYSFNPNTPQWTHYALTRSGTTLKLFINGIQVANATNSSNFTSVNPVRIAGSGNIWTGYLSEFRVLKGTALYTTNFTPPTAPLTNIANTSLLLNFTNAGIFDSTAKNVIETIGDAKVSTAQYKYGTGSIAFDGTGDYLKFPSTILSQFGSGDFTIEGWVYTTNISSLQIFLNRRSVLGASGLSIYFENSKINFRAGDSNNAAWEVVIDSGTLSSNTWYHFALTRSGNVWRAFVNGTQVGSNTTWAGTIGDETSNWIIGIGNDGSSYGLTGYIDDLRITKGIARYTSNFTPPTSAFKDK